MLQADLSLCWVHMLFCWFCYALAQMSILLFYAILEFKKKEKKKEIWLTTVFSLFNWCYNMYRAFGNAANAESIEMFHPIK